MKLYAISTKYLSLITDSDPIENKDITNNDMRAIFNASRSADLMVCDDKSTAIFLATSLLPCHDKKAEELLDLDIKIFGSPVIYTLEVAEDSDLGEKWALNIEDMIKYADTSTVPHFKNNHWVMREFFTDKVENLPSRDVYMINNLELADVQEATYFRSNLTLCNLSLGERIKSFKSVDNTNHMTFINQHSSPKP